MLRALTIVLAVTFPSLAFAAPVVVTLAGVFQPVGGIPPLPGVAVGDPFTITLSYEDPVLVRPLPPGPPLPRVGVYVALGSIVMSFPNATIVSRDPTLSIYVTNGLPGELAPFAGDAVEFYTNLDLHPAVGRIEMSVGFGVLYIPPYFRDGSGQILDSVEMPSDNVFPEFTPIEASFAGLPDPPDLGGTGLFLGHLRLNLVSVPEPTTATLVALGLAMLAVRRRAAR